MSAVEITDADEKLLAEDAAEFLDQVPQAPPKRRGRPPKMAATPAPPNFADALGREAALSKARQDPAIFDDWLFEGDSLQTWMARLSALWHGRQADLARTEAKAGKTATYRCLGYQGQPCGWEVVALIPEERAKLDSRDPQYQVRCPNPDHPAGIVTPLEMLHD